MKRILLLCDAIAPPAYMPRVRNLCSNLNGDQYEIVVVTEQLIGVDYKWDISRLIKIKYYKHNGLVGKLDRCIKWSMDLMFNYKDRVFVKALSKELRDNSYDMIVCSSFNLFPLIATYQLSKLFNLPYVVDLRDIAEQWGSKIFITHKLPSMCGIGDIINNLAIKYSIIKRNKIIKSAFAVTTISTWHRDLLKKINTNTHLIFNGYDLNRFVHIPIVDKHFKITYAGRIYDINFRSPRLLFQAIKELRDSNIISSAEVRIVWYIDKPSHNVIEKLALEYDIIEFIDLREFVPIDDIPKVLNEASVNLILTNSAKINGIHGIMTTKFFESIGVEKPILCVTSDEECLAEVIEFTKSGLAATQVDEVKSFLIDQFNIWKINGCTHTTISAENKEIFSRQYQAHQFAKIFDSAMSKNNNY